MSERHPRAKVRRLSTVTIGGLLLVGCGDEAVSDSSPVDAAAVADAGDLLVSLDYLQGVWCDHDGTTWTIDGATASLDDGSGGTGQMPVDTLFPRVPGSLISQADNEFVFDSAGEVVTFTRGAC